MGTEIRITEVGPRDGFQSLKCAMVPTEKKLKVIDNIIKSGIKHIEYTSFVSPKAIPQLADAADITRAIISKYPGMDFFPLIPNLRGAANAYELGLRKAGYVVSFSKSHNKANINRTHEESLDAFKDIRRNYPDMELVLDLATTYGCPFEGKYDKPEETVRFLKDYIDGGVKTITLCDTIGIADPAQVKKFLGMFMKEYPEVNFVVHFHDTRGLGMVNTLTAIEMGVTEVQSTLGGLGGCPFAPGASGNLATEDVVWMLNEMGYETGVKFEQIIHAAKMQSEDIRGNYSGHHINIEHTSDCRY